MKKPAYFGAGLFLCVPLCVAISATAWAEDTPSKTTELPDSKVEIVDAPPVAAPSSPVRTLGRLEWFTAYQDGYRQAVKDKSQLLIFFRDEREKKVADAFERDVLANKELEAALSKVVRVIVPVGAKEPNPAAKTAGVRLLDHGSFEHMYHRQGLAVIDLTDEKSNLYGMVISAHPFTAGLHYTVRSVTTILGLPRGTVTQRALIYAVRIHPAMPPSTNGTFSPAMVKQAHRNSVLMSQYGSVGHHDWGTRSAEATAETGRSPTEAAAMAMNPHLIDAATELVNMWQGSPSHWVMVGSPALLYGYDMYRAPGGSWYGTGVFAN